ncbi:MAG TPA: DNA-3-methyladenine glycosylase [Firmicutes bacterium]|nr:DNA-3-methyladenine glycosylase [Bacillota bacterium]
MKGSILRDNFYNRDTVEVARDLLGHYLYRESAEGLVSGIIVETEAYLSDNDPACHAARGKTTRNEVMFGPPGIAYVYFIYGNHYCFNVVTGPDGRGEAVLVRAVEPLDGLLLIAGRRGPAVAKDNLTSGPGKLCQAFAIDGSFNGHDLKHKPLYLGLNESASRYRPVKATPRIGLTVGEDKLLRYVVAGNPYLSRREPLE